MKRFTNAFVVALFACSLVVTPVLATDVDPEEQVEIITQNKADVENQVSSLQEELTELVDKISVLEGKLVDKGQEIIKATEDLGEAEEMEAEQYEAMKIRIKYMYEEGNTTALSTIFAAEDFSDLLNKAEYVSNVHSYDREKLDEYVETKEKIKDLKAELEVELADLEDLQKEFEEQKEVLNTTIEEKKDEIADLDVQLQAAVEAVAEKRRKEEEERQRQAEEEARRQAAEEAARQQAAQQQQMGEQQQEQQTQQEDPSQNMEENDTPAQEEPAQETPASSGNSSIGAAIVSAAYGQIGVPYVWGGSTPGVGLDCSGLVQYCLRTVGISVPHFSESIYAGGTKVSNPEPGDICWTPGHVAIYIGGGKMIEAQQSGTNIMISNVRASGFCRYW